MSDETRTLPPMNPNDPTATAAFVPGHVASAMMATAGMGDDEPADPAPPSAVPGYEIRGELGRGGMGVVYLARQTRLNRDVALKMVLGGGHASASDVLRFVAEAEAAAAVQHPGIVQAFESGQHDGLPYFALEYCPGGTLAKRLDGTPMPVRAAAELVEKLALAVQAAHDKGIVHRDLKPANVLFAADDAPKVSDFGLARRNDAASGLTATGAILGTPSYMSPEQARGAKDIGPAADIYALGAILYESLTGRPPFRAATALETVLQVQKDEPVAPSRLVPKLPRDVETICLKCLAKEPGRRYASAAALATDLRAYLEGRTIAARPAGWAEWAWKAARRRPAAAAGVLGTVAAVATVLIVVLFKNEQLEHERDAARHAEAEANRLRAVAEGDRETIRQLNADVGMALTRSEGDRARAEARLELALVAIDRMMVRMAGEKWARNPALQAERRAVLEEAVSVYRRFSAEAGDDARVRRQTALAQARIGTMYTQIAEYVKAREALAAAEGVQAELCRTQPDSAEFANELALTLISLGHLDLLAAKFAEAHATYTRGADQARRAISLAPGRDEFKLTLTEILTYLGHLGSSRGADEARKYHTEAVELARELASKPGAGYGARLFFAIGLTNLGAQDVQRGDPSAGKMLADAERAVASLAGVPPPTARWAELYDTVRGQLSIFQATQLLLHEQYAESMKKIDEGLAVYESLLAVHPKSFPYQLQKLNGLVVKSALLRHTDKPEEARKVVQQLLELSEVVVANSPSMTWVRVQFAVPRSQELIQEVQDGNVARLAERAGAVLRDLPPRTLVTNVARYNVACAYAQATRFAGAGTIDRENWAREAVAGLDALIADGYFAQRDRVLELDADTDLDPLRDRDDYKAFRAKLPNVAPRPRPVTSPRVRP